MSRTARLTTTLVAAALIGLLSASTTARAQNLTGQLATSPEDPKNALEICPIIPLFKIYSAQYVRSLTPKDSLILGMAYMNIKYDNVGRSHAPTAIVGYRRFLWEGLHLEYQLMPSYNWFYSSTDGQYYNSPELWNEFRLGYEIDFHIGDVPVFVTPQFAFGFALYGGKKPQAFIDLVKKDPFFKMPIFFVGAKW